MLPDYVQKYFWDTDAAVLDTQEHADYIIARLLEYGDSDAARWMHETYPRMRIVEVLTRSRQISPKSALFWARVLNINPKSCVCLKERLPRVHETR